jgi:Domain of unknown function (DUF4426)
MATTTANSSNTSTRRAWFAACTAAVLLLALGGCDSGGFGNRPQTARPAEETSQDFGNFEVHYNALRTDELTPDVARAYGIERSANRVLLNVSLLSKAPDGRTTPVDGAVKATAYNLNGQLKDLQVRRVQEGASIYFIGEVGISGNEILVFDIDAMPSEGGRYSVKFKREFFAD